MAKLTPEGNELRLRLCAHLRRLYAEHRFTAQQAMAERLGMDPGHFSALFNHKTQIGLDMAVQLHREFGESLNALCDDDPAQTFYPPGTWKGFYLGAPAPHAQHTGRGAGDAPPGAERPPRRTPPGAPPAPPQAASPSTARPGSRRTGAGRH